MMNETQQIQSASRAFVPQIYRAVMAQPTAALRAQVMRMILVGIDPALSDRIADRVQYLESKGTAPKDAVLQALSDGLTLHMHELANEIGVGGLGSLGTTRTTTQTVTRTPIAIAQQQQRTARIEAVSGAIRNVGGLVNDLTQTAGNIAVSAMQARTRQTVTGLPGMPQPAGALAPLGPDPYGPAGYGPPPPAGPPWGLIVGGVAVVGLLGVGYYMTTKKPKPAPAAAA